MRKNISNLYKITNLHDVDFSYKTIETDIICNQSNIVTNRQNIEVVAYKVASDSKCPTAIFVENNRYCVAIPSDAVLKIEKVEATPLTVRLKEKEGTNVLKGSDIFIKDKTTIVKSFLDFEIRKQLKYRKPVWSLNNSQFYENTPIKNIDGGEIELYSGFSYKLVAVGRELFICLDSTSKFLGKEYLSETINATNMSLYSSYKKKRCLYQNGDNWYIVEIEGFGNTISQDEYEGLSIYDYILKSTKGSRFDTSKQIKPNDVTLLYKYPNRSMQPHRGSVGLARLIYSTNDDAVKDLHQYTILEPNKRLDSNNEFIRKYFDSIYFNNKKLNITSTPCDDYLKSFPIPDLMYNNFTLSVGNNDGDTKVKDYAYERKRSIIEHQILNQKPFHAQYLIVPSNMDRNLVETFKSHAEGYLKGDRHKKGIAPKFDSFKIVVYDTLPYQSATIQVKAIEEALSENGVSSGYALLVLPYSNSSNKRIINNIHDLFKNRNYPKIKIQCASASKIKSYYKTSTDENGEFTYIKNQEKIDKYKSYLFNLLMEYLILNGKYPFALSNNPNYDIYIALDVHERNVGFSFFYKKGEEIVFQYEEVPSTAGDSRKRAEKVKAKFIVEKIYPILKDHLEAGYVDNPNGIILLRDGRSYEEEDKAMIEIIDKLSSDLLIDRNTLKYAVVDVHKSTALPLRVFTQNNSYNKIENPIAGTYKMTSQNEGFIFSTGFPFRTGGTSKPLQISLQSGDADCNKIMQDIFGQIMLAFSAPDRANGLPISMKLIDVLLQPLSTPDEDDVIIEDVLEEDNAVSA